MSTSLDQKRKKYIECGWKYDASPKSHYGYISVTQDLEKIAREKCEIGQEDQANIFELLARSR